MLEGFSSYLGAKPRRAMQIILCLSVVLVLILVVVLVQALDLSDPFAPPYPSEDTPLSLTTTGVTYTMDNTVTHYGSYPNYTSLRFHWGEVGPSGNGALWGLVADEIEQQRLSMNSSATVEVFVAAQGAVPEWISYYLVIKDVQGNGVFENGDSITFRTNSSSILAPLEDRVYIISLAFIDDGWGRGLGEYSCVVHGGKFYSWRSDTLNWNQPWWQGI
jgi:hypothetical protein